MANLSTTDSLATSTVQALVQEIYSAREVKLPSGQRIRLHSEITPDEGALIQQMIRQNRLSRSLEIGCAFGLSSLYICEAMAETTTQPHLILDPFQESEWQNVGLANLERAGLTNFEHRAERSEFALPELVQQNRLFDFVLIDGYHTFDQTLVDFYFVDRLLDVGGVCVIDDLQLPGVCRAARFIAKLPNYEVVQGARERQGPPSWRRRFVEAGLRGLARWLPDSLRTDVFADPLFSSDRSLGLNYEMVAFRKTGPDTRTSHWFMPF